MSASLPDDMLARRNALVLSAAQAFGGANAMIVVSTSGLAGLYLADTPALATLPFSLYVVGIALGTIPASMLSRHYGRRPAFLAGAAIGVIGGVVATWAILQGFFGFFCLGTMLCGIYAAFVQLYRFAAADTASPAFRAKAISWVLAGGLVAGVVGPQLVIATRDVTSPIPFAGAFMAQTAVTLIGIGILLFLRIPKPEQVAGRGSGRPLGVIVRDRNFLVALMCGIISYALMNFIMTATPIAMVACGHTGSDAAWTIQWHVLGMFGPSFFTGSLINRFGAPRIVAAGLLLIAACASIALTGLSLLHFDVALVLLGIGWNFGFIGSTAMVAACHRPEERNKVQALNDFLMFGTMAIGSLISGGTLEYYGWSGVNMVAYPLVAIALATLAFGPRRAPAGA